jgi:hypothetical protein
MAIVAGFASCTKDLSDDFRAYPNNPLNDTIWARNISATAPVNEILDSTLPIPLIDSFNANSADTVRFPNNVELSFAPNSFISITGTPVVGKIKLEFQPLLKKGDMIKALQSTTNNNTLLELTGQFFLKVSKNGQELSLAPNTFIKIKYPDTQDNPQQYMNVFKGTESSPPPSWGKDTSFTWQKGDIGTSIGIWYKTGSGPNNKGYEMTTKNIRWIGCGRFLDSTLPKNKLTAILPPNFTNKNTLVFAVLENAKTIVELKSDYSSRSFAAFNIPLNTKLNIVTISKIGNAFYYGIRNINDIGNTAIYSVSPDKKSLSYILSELDKL